MVKKYSLFEDRKRNTDRGYKYEVFWGTRGSKGSKKVSSLKLAKHPLLTWARDIEVTISRTGHPESERVAVREMIETINNMDDIEGTRTFTMRSEELSMTFEAVIVRLPATPSG